ncbi:hypothetical protein DPMN_157198 [Dreissena polymorpha]|uniref:Uncharacterized protein n=1 Tax=Dreissena polymorpha TaxID=45954 RepID=A0A9D4EIW3_DREPO|nr:hypothetical protein DPMN_157198 [Dreissena polymorpha]
MKRYVAKESPRTKEELEVCLVEFWKTGKTVEACNGFIRASAVVRQIRRWRKFRKFGE